MKIDYSLTDISSLETCSCSTCTCSNEYLKESNYDCLTYILIILYESSIWCMKIIYEFFFKSFYQIIQELRYRLISLHRNTEENNDSYIVVISVRSVYCQTEINKNDIDLNLFRYLHSRETQTEQQLSDEKKVRYSTNESSVVNNSQRQRMIDDNRIPLTLNTNLHSNVSLDNVDYFITKYIRQLFTDKHHLY